MGILSDYQAIFEIGKLRKGKQAKLSLSQIVCIITNMSEAKSNLSRKQFDEVYALFKDYRKRTIKMYIDPDEFVDIAVRIIRDFDKLAPYEKYSGRNGEALSLMMRDLREENSDDIENELHAVVDMYSNSNDEYINYIIANSDGVTKDQAKAFVGVLITNEIHGKEEAVRRFPVKMRV